MNMAMRAVSREPRWDGTLAECPAWCPREGDLLVVAAHPDDEVRGAGGLIHAWVARGGTVRVLSVSDGETEDPACCALASARREELNEALRKLCPTHVAVTRLGLPLGKISQHCNRVRNALLSLTSGEVTLVAPDERAAHPDHEAVGQVCVEFARARGISLARYGIGKYGVGPGAAARRAGERRAGQRGALGQVRPERRGEARQGPRGAVLQSKKRLSARSDPFFAAGGASPERAYETFLV